MRNGAQLLLATAIGATLLGSCSSADEPEGPGDQANPPAITTPPPAPSKTPKPEFDVTYTSTCMDDFPQVFVTGDYSDNTRTGYRFIADVTVYNDGDIRARPFVTVSWLLVGGERVTMERMMRDLPPGQHRRVGFTKPATFDQVSRMAAHRAGDKLCTAKVNALPVGQPAG